MSLDHEVKNLKVALLVSALLLCVAMLPRIPDSFFIFLRILVCTASGYAAYFLHGHATLQKHFIPMVIVAIVFNPVVPIQLGSELGLLIDMATAVYFLTLSKKI